VRSVLLATVAVAAAFAAATAAQALPNQLVSNATASVSGGCGSCGHSQNQTDSTVPSLTSTASDAGAGGSFGHADVTTTYGTQHVKASAFWAASDPGPDVQTLAFSEYDENFAPGVLVTGFYNLNFLISGTLSAQPTFGPGSGAALLWDFEDLTHPGTLSSGTFIPGAGITPLSMTIPVPVGDAASLRVEFEAFAFAGDRFSGQTLSADFSHTVHTYIDAVNGGPDVIGQSGHDYATPTAASGAAEPAAWALMLIGFGALGSALRRPRRPETACA